MKPMIRCLLAGALCAILLPAQAKWGDISYDPSPTKIDEDYNAKYDMFGLISFVVAGNSGMTMIQQSFESGFVGGQVIDDWVSIGSTRVRFGFGNSLDQIQWRALIGQVDTQTTTFGVTHPHGTYGNTADVANQPRNYIVDNFYLTSDPTSGVTTPGYFVMQFEKPVSTVSFSMTDYAAAPGELQDQSLWNGQSFANAQLVHNTNRHIPYSTPDEGSGGEVGFVLGTGGYSDAPPYVRAPFNLVALRLNGNDSTIGFDNITASLAPVPEPETYGMMLAGLGMFVVLRRRQIV